MRIRRSLEQHFGDAIFAVFVYLDLHRVLFVSVALLGSGWPRCDSVPRIDRVSEDYRGKTATGHGGYLHLVMPIVYISAFSGTVALRRRPGATLYAGMEFFFLPSGISEMPPTPTAPQSISEC